jgi:hypothetical protein
MALDPERRSYASSLAGPLQPPDAPPVRILQPKEKDFPRSGFQFKTVIRERQACRTATYAFLSRPFVDPACGQKPAWDGQETSVDGGWGVPKFFPKISDWRARRRVGFAIFVRNCHFSNDFKLLDGELCGASNRRKREALSTCLWGPVVAPYIGPARPTLNGRGESTAATSPDWLIGSRPIKPVSENDRAAMRTALEEAINNSTSAADVGGPEKRPRPVGSNSRISALTRR